jgi:Predicted amidohydrolase
MSRLGIACVQLEALGLERAEEALERALQGVEEAGRHRPDLILLPECTYPAYYLHSLEAYHRAEPRPLEEVLRLFGEKARRHRAYVAVGLVRPHPSGRLRNSVALINPQARSWASTTNSSSGTSIESGSIPAPNCRFSISPSDR